MSTGDTGNGLEVDVSHDDGAGYLLQLLRDQAATAVRTEQHLDTLRADTRVGAEAQVRSAGDLQQIRAQLGDLVDLQKQQAARQEEARLAAERRRAEAEDAELSDRLEARRWRRKVAGQVVVGLLGLVTSGGGVWIAYHYGAVAAGTGTPVAIEQPAPAGASTFGP